MNKYLWCWIAVSVLFLIWSLGSVAAKRNHYLSFTNTWLGTIYLIVGLILIVVEILFWIKGMKTMMSEDEQQNTNSPE